ncbi:MAG: ATP-binding protein [Neisseriaceae bacterium]
MYYNQDNNLIEYFSEIIDSINVSIYWKDLDSCYLGCNTYAAQEVGLEKPDDIIGKSDYDLFGKDIADKFRENDLKIIRENVELIIEEEGILPDGERIVRLSSKRPLYNKNRKVIGVVGNSVDITAKKEKERLELENQAHMIRAIEDEKFRNRVGQMIHDIQQPLASLQMTVNSTKDIPEERRIVLRDSTIAITDITNQLLRQYEPNSKIANENNERRVVLVSTVLIDIVGDKRLIYKNLPIKFEYDINSLNAFVCIKVNATDFSCAISNIIKNAAESLPKSGGLVEVKLTANDEWVNITIIDNGKGIPRKILEKINNNESITYGKNGGHGLGLSQVKDMVETNYGEFSIVTSTNKVGHGTTVTLRFPKVLNPDWLIEKIQLQKNDIVIILDDDKNIHGGWNSKLEHIFQKLHTLSIKHFFTAQDVIEFVNNLSTKEKQNILFLCDYELIGQQLNGLDVISQVKIKRSILVTSHYANIELRKNAVKNKVRILPKHLVHIVPIHVAQASKKKELVNVHMVFVDDEKIFTNLLISRYYNNLLIAQYSNPLEFLDEVDQYPKDTRIILDNYYYMPDGGSYNIDGITIAEQLYNKGFTNLVLLTGEKFKVPDYLKLVLKIDHDILSKLDII